MRKNQEKAAEVKKVAKAGSYENSIVMRAAKRHASSIIANPDEHPDAVERTITGFVTVLDEQQLTNRINNLFKTKK